MSLVMKKAVVIIPTYNERDNIGQTIKKLLAVFKDVKDWSLSVLVVDDTSPDKTYELVRALGRKHKNVELLLNRQKQGLGGAYLKGMKHAFEELKADVVFEFDADLSHDPDKIPDFLKKIDEGYDLVLGCRYMSGGSIPSDWGLHRKFLSIVGNWVISLVLTNFNIKDWTTGYRAVSKSVYLKVRSHLGSERLAGYTFQIAFLYNTIRLGFRVAEVPFHFVDRTKGQSKLGPEYLINTLLYIFKVRLKEVWEHKFFRFAVVGAVGALVQLLTLQIWRLFLPFQLAFFLAIEAAIISNFFFNNVWTFSDRQLRSGQMLPKFLQFNLASGGSIVIQQAIAIVGEFGIGLFYIGTLPFIGLDVDTGTLYAVIGIALGMFWNFFAYTRFIWNHKPGLQ